MTPRIIPLITILLATIVLHGCGGGDDDGNGNGDGGDGDTSSSLEVTLRGAGADDGDTAMAKASVQSLKRTVQSNHEVNCVVDIPEIAGVTGACLTPIRISGTVSGVTIGRQTGGPPARLLGGGSGLNNGGTIAALAFDLADPTALEGEDNIEGDEAGEFWDMVAANFTHMDLKFELNGRYWTVRHGFITEPIIEDEVIDECIPFETNDEPGEGDDDGGDGGDGGDGEQGDNLGGYRQDLIDNGFLIEGASFRKGDLLFCVKDDDSDCAVNEFKWLDLATDSLVETRPDSPRQVQVIADHVTTCAPSHDGPGYDTNLGGFSMFALVDDPFMISAVFPENSDVKVYTFSQDGLTSVEGTEMSLYVDFDVTNTVFFPGVDEADLATMTDEQIAEAVFLKPLYIKDNAPDGTGYDPGVSVSVNATLTGEPPPPPAEPDEGETPE